MSAIGGACVAMLVHIAFWSGPPAAELASTAYELAETQMALGRCTVVRENAEAALELVVE